TVPGPGPASFPVTRSGGRWSLNGVSRLGLASSSLRGHRTRLIHRHQREKPTTKITPLKQKACVLAGTRRGEAACAARGGALEQRAKSGSDRSPASASRGELLVGPLSRDGWRSMDRGGRPGAQTERRGGAGPVRGLLGAKHLTGRVFLPSSRSVRTSRVQKQHCSRG